MLIEQSHSPFEIITEELSEWKGRPHKHNFFELVFIEEGEGQQCINQQMFNYRKHNIFLLPPLDCHSFRISSPTRFVFIRFTNQVFDRSRNGGMNFEQWFRNATYILVNYNKLAGDVIRNADDKEHLINNIRIVLHEYRKDDKFSNCIIQTTLVTILNILARNIERAYLTDQQLQHDNRFHEVLNYVQHHLFETELLKVPRLAQAFNVSPTYFGEYFRKHAGEPLQDYIIKSRLKVAEARLLYSDNSVKEIAYELGFTDASHFSRTFKNYHGYTIQEFKKKGRFSLLDS